MKTLKIAFLLIFCFNFSYAQLGEIGYSINQIKYEYSNEFKDIRINTFKDEERYSMFAKNSNYSFCYFANSDSIVYESIAAPLNDIAIKEMKNKIDNIYKKTSDSTYTHLGMIIEVCYPKENDPLKKYPVYYKYYLPKEKYRYY
jgi:hypothetical protein